MTLILVGPSGPSGYAVGILSDWDENDEDLKGGKTRTGEGRVLGMWGPSSSCPWASRSTVGDPWDQEVPFRVQASQRE